MMSIPNWLYRLEPIATEGPPLQSRTWFIKLAATTESGDIPTRNVLLERATSISFVGAKRVAMRTKCVQISDASASPLASNIPPVRVTHGSVITFWDARVRRLRFRWFRCALFCHPAQQPESKSDEHQTKTMKKWWQAFCEHESIVRMWAHTSELIRFRNEVRE